MFGGNGDKPARIPIAVVDQDAQRALAARRCAPTRLHGAERPPMRRRACGKATRRRRHAGRLRRQARRAFVRRRQAGDRLLYDPSQRPSWRWCGHAHAARDAGGQRRVFGGATAASCATCAAQPIARRRSANALAQTCATCWRVAAQRAWNRAASARRGTAARHAACRSARTPTRSSRPARTDAPYNGYAHSFAGMGVQFILFMGIELGIGMLLERQRGLWKRLRAAPLSRAHAARQPHRRAARSSR